ncbi:MAG: TonB family protein [Blastomonas sp.]
MGRTTMRLCPPPGPAESPHADLTQRFADDFMVTYAIRDGKISYDTPCIELESATNREMCLNAIAADPDGQDRLFAYTVTDNLNPSDPREMDFDRWKGPVAGHDVSGMTWGERWYRFADPGRVVDYYPNAVLAGSCAIGDVTAFDAAIAAGASLNWSDNDRSGIGMAIQHNQPDMVQRLIDAGWTGAAWRDAVWKMIPAVENGYVEIVEMILGACRLSVEELSRLIGYSCDTAMAERLLADGADPAFALYDGENPAFLVLRYEAKKGIPPRIANAPALIRWFDAHGADIATVSKSGITLLLQAVWSWQPDAIRTLLEMGAPLDISYEYDGQTPAMAAQKQGHGEEFQALLDAAAPRTERQPIRWSPPAPEEATEPEPVDTGNHLPEGDTHPSAFQPASADACDEADDEERQPSPSPDWVRHTGLVLAAAGILALLASGFSPIGWGFLAIGIAIIFYSARHGTAEPEAAQPRFPASPPILKSGTIRGDDYPSRALREDAEGKVVVAITVGSDGRPSGVSVVTSSGHDSLDQASCSIIQRRFRYHPARNDRGDPVEQVVRQAITWQIPEIAGDLDAGGHDYAEPATPEPDAPPAITHDPVPWQLLSSRTEQVEVWRMTDQSVKFLVLVRDAAQGVEVLEAPTSKTWLGDPPVNTGETAGGEKFLYELEPHLLTPDDLPDLEALPEWARPHRAEIAARLARFSAG